MKPIILVPALAVLVTACSTGPKNEFEQRAAFQHKAQIEYANRAVEEAPEWMQALPKSTSAVYQNGTAVSYDMGLSVHKAKTMAYGKICMAAGGRVDQQSKLFRSENNQSATEIDELAIKSFCPGVDITGVEMVETKTIAEGPRFRTYVLVALPLGDANPLAQERDARQGRADAQRRSEEAFREMEQNRQAAPRTTRL